MYSCGAQKSPTPENVKWFWLSFLPIVPIMFPITDGQDEGARCITQYDVAVAITQAEGAFHVIQGDMAITDTSVDITCDPFKLYRSITGAKVPRCLHTNRTNITIPGG